MKDFILKYKFKIASFFVIFIVVIPLIINVLFKIEAPCNILVAEWIAGDALSFYGTMLASASTIIGVYISIEYAQRNYRIDEANRVKPYFALTHYNHHSKNSFSSILPFVQNDEIESQDVAYEEYKLERVYIIIEKTGIQFKDRLSSKQNQILQHGGIEWIYQGENCYSCKPHSVVSIPIEVENVGNGAATNVVISFYKKGEKCKGVNLYTIKKDGSFYFHVFCDDTDIVIGNNYVIELLYGDIIGNSYSQKYPVTFMRKKDRFHTRIELRGEQNRRYKRGGRKK